MLLYYGLAFLISSATLFVLRRQECKEESFLRILPFLIGFSIFGLILALVPLNLPLVLFLFIQLAAWAVFLWGVSNSFEFINTIQ